MRRALAALLLFATAAQAETPIRFARGASGAEVAGAVARGETRTYTLEARAGQRMELRIASTEKNAVFQLHAPGTGEAMPGAAPGDDARQWSGTLPRSGAWRIVVGSTRGGAEYRLSVLVR
jgi:hypothetical protein